MVLQRVRCVFGSHTPEISYTFERAPFGVYVEVVQRTTCSSCHEPLETKYAVEPPKSEPHRTLVQERGSVVKELPMYRAVCWCDWHSSWVDNPFVPEKEADEHMTKEN